MLRLGRLYGIRIHGHWRIARADLEHLRHAAGEHGVTPTASSLAEATLRGLLEERDQVIGQLQRENERLAAQNRDLLARVAALAAQQAAPPRPHQEQQAGAETREERRAHGVPSAPIAARSTAATPAHHLLSRVTTALRRFNRM
jgi:hypothetical protein